MYKKYFKISAVILALILITYSLAWIQQYRKTAEFYNQAQENFKKGDYVTALKGKKVLKKDRTGYVFQGGFQQAMEAWESTYAIPKPSEYQKSKEMIDTIVKEKINIKSGLEAFKRYFKVDNAFLGEILLRVGDLYVKDNDVKSAEEMYGLVKEAFANQTELIKQVDERISLLPSIK